LSHHPQGLLYSQEAIPGEVHNDRKPLFLPHVTV
jgi:hypothetical protein